MNIQEYISSGIVESYVLGLASSEERAEFEHLCTEHPELVDARDAFEKALEKQAFENSIEPPRDLKASILQSLSSGTKVVSMQSVRPRSSGFWKVAAAACVILLAGSIYWNLSLHNKNKKLQDQYSNTVARLNDVENDVRVMRENPAIKMASMKGQPVSPQSFTTVYWDTTTHDVYLLVNNLPKPAADKQYQIWALLDGKPIDLGMIDNEYFLSQKKLLVRARNVEKAQAFAITLEDRGGHPTPQGQIFVMGNP